MTRSRNPSWGRFPVALLVGSVPLNGKSFLNPSDVFSVRSGNWNPFDSLRIGLGFDSHRIAPGGPLVLGGLRLDVDVHFVGHSDADVLLHAITDALLSGSGMPDIGQLFPNTQEENRGRDSAEMLQLAMTKVRQSGWELINLDCVVELERPKIAPVKEAMRMRVAEVLAVQVERIAIKGKTGEGVGEIGRGELCVAHCVALLGRSE